MDEITANLRLIGDERTRMATIRSLAHLGAKLLGFDRSGTIVTIRASYETMRSIQYHINKRHAE